MKSGLVKSNLYRNYLSIMLESFEVTTTEKVLLSFLIRLAKLKGFPVFIAVKVPVELFGQKLGVTVQAGSESVVDSPRK